DPSKSLGAKLTVREALDRGVADLQGQLQDQPEVKSHLLRELATIYGELGESEQAVSLADEAVSLIEPMRHQFPKDWLRALYVRAGRAQQFPSSTDNVLRPIETFLKAAKLENDETMIRHARNLRGLEWARQGDSQRALTELDWVGASLLSALGVRSIDQAAEPPLADTRRELVQDLAINMHNRCRSHVALGDLQGGEDRCLAAARLKLAVWPENHPIHISTQITLANIASKRGDLDAAIAAEQVVFDRLAVVYGPDHVRTAYAQANLGTSLKQARRYDEAAPLLESALAKIDSLLGQEHPAYALVLNNYANLVGNRGEWERSLVLHNQAVTLRRQNLGIDHKDLAESLMNRGNVYKQLGQPRKALEDITAAVDIYHRTVGDSHPDALLAIANLASKLLDVDRPEEAATQAERVLATLDRQEDLPAIRIQAQYALTRAWWALGRRGEAHQMAEQALQQLRTHPDELISADEVTAWIEAHPLTAGAAGSASND
ncbi:MAG: tetratricopeptide repeat protein, partial [Xanthomonadales bacterium]|nr:tetratricopeptide repeat protein [Xanthomonadales bacterium]